MIKVAPSEKDKATDTLKKRLCDAADQLRANSGLKAQEYSGLILGLIFLHVAEAITFAKRIQSSRQPRDLLMPRLLSGDVELAASRPNDASFTFAKTTPKQR